MLLLALSADPRATVVALAERLDMARNTVQARLARLDRAGAFLAYERSVNPVPLGYPLQAFIEVDVEQKRLAAVVEQLERIPEIIQAHGLSGPIDLLLRVLCRSAEDLFRINGLVLAVDGVQRTETALAMEELIPYRITPLLKRE